MMIAMMILQHAGRIRRRGIRVMTGTWRWRQGQSNSRDTSLLNPLELIISGIRLHFVVGEDMATKRITKGRP
jgi:hypothetical protein